VRPDSQDVGLEAAIIERVRNSSLVECACTDNVARLKHRTEAVEPPDVGVGRGALCRWWCEPPQPRSLIARTGGAGTRANAGMSSVMDVRTIHTASLRVPGQRQSTQGESGPKPRTLSRRRWKAGQRLLHQSASLRVKRGRGREGEPIEWTGWAACLECEAE
jgi:hypothetical protein